MTSPGPGGPPDQGGAPDRGEAPDAGEAPARRPRRGYWVPGLIAMAALLLIGVAFGAGDLSHRSSSTLSGPDVDSEIALAIQAQQGTHDPPDVHCPPSEPVRQGWQFVCTIEHAGSARLVHVTEIDGRGHLHLQLGT